MTFTSSDVDDLKNRFADLKTKLDLSGLKQKKEQLETLTSDPQLWQDETKAKTSLQEFDRVKNLVDDIESVETNLLSLIDLSKLLEENPDASLEKDTELLFYSVSKDINKLELFVYLSGKYDRGNAILSIHSGQGGTEAMDWASMLDRMYRRFFERRGWGFEMVDYSAGEEAGLKSVTYLVKAPFAYGYLKNEKGTHRLVRLSPFNADNLRQTSFAGVDVMPLIEESDQVEIKNEDLEFDALRASGAGGQNVNKVSSAVRIRHIPTGIVVTSQSQRYQEQNRKIALQILQAKLWEIEEGKRQEELRKIKGEHQIAGWGHQIRSYVLHPYKLVKDLRTEAESTDPDSVLDGDLEIFIETELKYFAQTPSSAKLD